MFKTLSRILDLSGPYRNRIYKGIAFSLLHSAASALDLLAIMWIMLHIESLSYRVILQALFLLILGLIGKFLSKWQITIKISGTGFDIFRDKRIEIGKRLKTAPMGYFSEHRLGSIHAAITTGMNELETSAMTVIEQILGGVIYGLICTIFLFLFDWRIALITLAGLLCGVLIINLIQRRADKTATLQMNAKSQMTGDALEYIQGISVLRLFGKGKDGFFQLEEAFRQKKIADLSVEKTIMWPVSLYRYVFRIASCGIILAASLLCLNGGMSFPICVTILFSAFLVYGQMDGMAATTALMRIINTALNTYENVLDIPEMPGKKDASVLNGFGISLNNVSFKYDDRQIIKNVSAELPERSSTAIVGPSGSGKTTLCNLIARFWDVQDGAIFLGGENIKELQCDAVISQISMVFQNVYLFSDTVENNIKFGKPDASYDEVVEAAKKAQCHDFISRLPAGYNTIIGEGGSNFSGGEKQRISIARAILKNAPIVILDEATSSVDPENEYALVQAIQELTREKTLVTIAHRLSTVQTADQILVLENGEIVQRGNHKTLSKQTGIYRNFLNIREQAAEWHL